MARVVVLLAGMGLPGLAAAGFSGLAPPPPAIETAQLPEGPRLALPATGALVRLRADDRELRLGVRLGANGDPGTPRYRFLLEGHDPGWVEVGADGIHAFPRLFPGSYVLHVSGAAARGPWSEPSSLTLLVDPPWWATRGALAGFGVALMAALSVLALVHRGRVRRREAWKL
ncbi:triple tyrosine motif-containing protein, partial [uncultured Arenimonas sp.]|uniref:triple tyrosine motif-containing protein n=1 Tax=uncultured Arenimonas sp. TaxID=546226 RepID=UPI0030D98A5E